MGAIAKIKQKNPDATELHKRKKAKINGLDGKKKLGDTADRKSIK